MTKTMMGCVGKVVEAGAHIEFPARYQVNQRKIYRCAAIVIAAFCGVGHISFIPDQLPEMPGYGVRPVSIKYF